METAQDHVRVHLRITGRVQGVYFRASAVDEAQKLGVTGWVLNSADGAVEAVAEGRRSRIEELIGWCRVGPEGAKVTKVEIHWEAPRHEFTSFGVKR